MRDVEFLAELFLLTMHGVLDGSGDLLDDFFAEYDEEIPDEDQHRERFDAVLTYLELLPLDWKKTRWRNLADLYALWAALLRIYDDESDEWPNEDEVALRLAAFSDALKAPEDERERAYADAVRQGQSKDTNREIRADILEALLRE